MLIKVETYPLCFYIAEFNLADNLHLDRWGDLILIYLSLAFFLIYLTPIVVILILLHMLII